MNPLAHRIAVLATAAALVSTACSGGSNSSDTTSSRKRNAALNVADVNLHKVVEVSSGNVHHAALGEDGQVYVWGWTAPSGLDVIPGFIDGGSRFVTMSSGDNNIGAIDDKGNPYAWGSNTEFMAPRPALPTGATRWTDIWMGDMYAVLQDDTCGLTGWSYNKALPKSGSGPGCWKKFVGLSDANVLLNSTGRLLTVGRDEYDIVTKIGTQAVEDVSGIMDSIGILYQDGSIDLLSRRRWIPHFVPKLNDPERRLVSIAVGSESFSAIDNMGSAYTWSVDSAGMFTLTGTREPTNGGTKFVSLSSTESRNISAVDDAGNLYVWGDSRYGLLNLPPVLLEKATVMPIAAAGNTAFGIDDTGAIVEFDNGPGNIGYLDEGSYISIATSSRHALVVTRSGTVDGWGAGESGQLDIPGDLNGVVQVGAGFAYSVALRANGTVVEWGSHVGKNLVPMPVGLSGVKQIVAGNTHVLAIKTNGSVVAWGDNRFGNATVPAEASSNVISVATGDGCDAALKSDGSIVYWGGCTEAMSAKTSLPGAKSLAASSDAFAAIMDDGSVTVWGEEYYGETDVPADVADVAALVGGSSFFLSVDKTGFVRAWGETETPQISIPSSFSGLDPSTEDWVPDESEGEGAGGEEDYVYTDEDVNSLADFILTLPPAQQKLMLERLGLTTKQVANDPSAAATALKEAPKEVVSSVVQQANEASTSPSASQSSAATLPPARSPGLGVGSSVSTGAAVTMLGLKKVTKVSFVIPKKAGAVCAVSKTSVKGIKAGPCDVTVKYTDSKKKSRSVTLSLVFG